MYSVYDSVRNVNKVILQFIKIYHIKFSKNVTKKFDDFMLDHISFTVPTGRIVGFIGENGAGKSTTINLILDQLKLDAGEIRILGKQNHSYLHKENIGVVFDECKFHSVLNEI